MAHRRVVRSAKRKTLWLDFASGRTAETNLPAASSLLSSSLNAAALALRPFTIVRTRGMLWTASDQVAGPEDAFGAFGYAVVSDQASAIGVTAIPTPITDAGSSLFFSWTPWMAAIEQATAVGFDATPGFVQHFDSKAMRKVEIG